MLKLKVHIEDILELIKDITIARRKWYGELCEILNEIEDIVKMLKSKYCIEFKVKT